MVSPELRNSRARLRLRDNADPFDCLDLSIQSSSLLSPSLQPQFDVSNDEFLENSFPFQVSPTEASTRTALQNNTGKAVHLHSQVHNTRQRADTASDPLSPLTNTQLNLALVSPCAAFLPAAEPLTTPHLRQDEVRCCPAAFSNRPW